MALTTVPVELANLDGAVTVNESSADVDFRIESNGNANMLFVNGGSDSVLVGHNTDISIAGESHELQVYDTNFSAISAATFRAGSDGASISLAHSRSGTIGTQTILQDGDTMGAINFMGSDGTDMASYGARIYVEVDGTPGSNDMPGRIKFATTADGANGSTDRMTINNAGNIGIGTASPTSNAGWAKFIEIAGGTNNAVVLDGTDGQEAGIGAQDSLYVDCYGHSTATNNNIILRTQASNSTHNGTEAMRINSDQRVMIGQTSPGVSGLTSAKFSVGQSVADYGVALINTNASDPYGYVVKYTADVPNDTGHVLYLGGDNSAWRFYAASNGDVFTVSGTDIQAISDKRLKENTADFTDGLKVLNTLNPVTYTWKEGQGQDKTGTQYGFLAQDIEASSEVKDNMNLFSKKTLGTDPTFPKKDLIDDDIEYASQLAAKDALYISAIQELSKEIETLQTKVKALEEA